MANQWLVRLLPLGFISACLFLGINRGSNIRQENNQANNVITVTPVNNFIQESESIKKLSASEIQPEIKTEIQPDTKPDTKPEIQPEIQPDIQGKTITIQAVGDVIPGTNYPDYRLPSDKNQLIPKSVRAYLQRADILLGNFESTLTKYRGTTKDINREKVFAFRSPPSYAKLFADVGFDVFHIANNHAFDFGEVGFQDTVKNLNTVNIKTLGHKNQILYLRVNDVPIAMIGFAPYEFYNSIQDIETAIALVSEARKNANIVIISMHAGAEGTKALRVKNKTEYFSGENRGNSILFARSVIDAGADIVLGHGPHVPRAMEIYKGKLIAYSLGNFLGYRTLSTRAEAGYSMILEVKMNSEGQLVSSKIIPVHLSRNGIPFIDQRFRTVGLLRNLINSDFPDKPIKINSEGEILIN
jgi:poly-gamma-glutamate capsule biosynthesis protein CapA/YwtB (metallophosphatase superfamily)